MTKSEKVDLLMTACSIAQGHYRAKAQSDGISPAEWCTCMVLSDIYADLYTDLLLDYFKVFEKEID